MLETIIRIMIKVVLIRVELAPDAIGSKLQRYLGQYNDHMCVSNFDDNCFDGMLKMWGKKK